jgi:hypothetical protein
MLSLRDRTFLSAKQPWRFRLAVALLLFALPGAGCKSHSHTSDPQLRSIDESLEKSFPSGTPRVRIELYLNSRGYTLEPASGPQTLVAVIRHIDTDTLQPVTARVTFHFDSANRLATYEMVRAPDAPIQP